MSTPVPPERTDLTVMPGPLHSSPSPVYLSLESGWHCAALDLEWQAGFLSYQPQAWVVRSGQQCCLLISHISLLFLLEPGLLNHTPLQLLLPSALALPYTAWAQQVAAFLSFCSAPPSPIWPLPAGTNPMPVTGQTQKRDA